MPESHQKSATHSESHVPEGFCPRCNYAIDAGRCPECGLDVPRPRKYRTKYWIRRTFKVGLLIIVLSLLYQYGPYYYLYYFTPRERLCAMAHGPGMFHGLANSVIRAQRGSRLAMERVISDELFKEVQNNPTHPWAGEYFIPDSAHLFGDVPLITGGGVILLGPSRRYVWFESECYGCSNLVDWGRVVDIQRDRLTLVSEHPDPIFGAKTKRALLRVRWNGRHFLYPPELAEKLAQSSPVNKEVGVHMAYELLAREQDRLVKLTGWPETPYKLHVQFKRQSMAK